ncbi:amino acid adenylation domain-containing protein [Cellvibrio sp.]|uniref:amino acid adenylation domain-containing protein n=1 Tax=Cellvibrio sp. TaxID=1965322 RepID=UPI00375051A0
MRYLPNGDLQFLGRIDHQVKIRGFRIELGEIEHALNALEDVKQAVVSAQEAATGDHYLVAYVVLSQAADEQPPARISGVLRARLKQSLPDYMVPAAFVILDALPLTTNGKVDRKALPVPEVTPQGDAFVAPTTELETQLCDLWQQVLGVKRVGITDNFFELGGHSLIATRLVSEANRQLHLSLTLKALFHHQTIQSLAPELHTQDHASPHIPAITPFARDTLLLPSYAQQRLWLLNKIEGDSAHYNMPGGLRLSGDLNIDALEKALRTIIQRHESLRTCFREHAGDEGKAIQIIQDADRFQVDHADLSHLQGHAQEAALADLVENEAGRLFDLSHDFMLRARLIRLAEREHVLLVTMHHIASDGWSMSILIHEFCVLYRAWVLGLEARLPELPIQYVDYAHWQREWLQGDVLDRQLDYWMEQLSGLPVVHGLPLDRARPAVQSFSGKNHYTRLNARLTRQLRERCQACDATLFMGLHAAFSVLLSRYSNETDIVVGSPIANREQAEVANLIGFFMNVLVLRSDLSGSPSFNDVLERSQQTLLEAYSHQQVPFEQLVEKLQPERSLNHSPLFQVMLVLQNHDAATLELPALAVTAVKHHGKVAKYDLTLTVTEQEESLHLDWEYNTDLFDPLTIENFSVHFDRLLTFLVNSPDRNISDAEFLTEAELHQQVREYNQTENDYPADRCIHELFEAQVAASPEAIAVVHEQQSLTYDQLNVRANKLAHYLITQKKVKAGTLVGICLERSLNMMIGLLAVLKAGGAYVPLDPGYPEERLKYMLQDAGLDIVLTQENLKILSPVTAEQALCLDDSRLRQIIEAQPDTNVARSETGLDSGQLAYVIYTSGSTGKPKGVMVEHGAVVNFLSSVRNAPGMVAEDHLLAVTSISFDIHVLELYLPLISGARLTMATADQCIDGEALKSLLENQKITMMQATPATWRMLLESGWRSGSTHHWPFKVLCGGEAWPDDLREKLVGIEGLELWNMYGPTEATVWSSTGRVTDKVHLGKPLANTTLYILDEHLKLVPKGVAGELYIGGAGLARGYLNNPELTAEKFISNPFIESPDFHSSAVNNHRLYRTGDLVRYLPDGTMEFIGRRDSQVKIRGFRIEMGEIEARLIQHPQVKEAVVVAQEDEGEKRLVGYVIPETRGNKSFSEGTVGFSLFYFGGETYENHHKYELYLKSAKFADENGLEAIWTPERHFDAVGSLYPNPSILSAALATITHNVHLRAGSVVLPLHDPIRVAEEWSVVDNLSNGRVGLAMASGWHTRDFALAPHHYESRKKVLLEGIKELKTLWEGNSITRKDGVNSDVDIQIFPKPVQKTLPLWMTAAGNPETFIEAGRQGMHLLTHLLGQTIDELANNIALYRDSLKRHGHKEGRVSLMIHTYLGNDFQETLNQAKQPFIHYMKSHISLLVPVLKSLNIPTDDLDDTTFDEMAEVAFERYSRTSSLIGTPETALPVAKKLVEAGVDEIACLLDWMELSAACEGLDYIRQLMELTRNLAPGRRMLAEHCSASLPPYMVPSIFVLLDKFPLTANGKIDRKSLPKPDLMVEINEYVAPVTATEKKLCEIWQELLVVHQVGTTSNFFELGGHSLLVVKMLSRVKKQLGVSIPTNQFFEAPRISSMSKMIDKELRQKKINQIKEANSDMEVEW